MWGLGVALLGAIALAVAVFVTMRSLPGYQELKSSQTGQMIVVRAADGACRRGIVGSAEDTSSSRWRLQECLIENIAQSKQGAIENNAHSKTMRNRKQIGIENNAHSQAIPSR